MQGRKQRRLRAQEVRATPLGCVPTASCGCGCVRSCSMWESEGGF